MLAGSSWESGWQRISYEHPIFSSPSIESLPARDGFLSETIAGLSQPQKMLPCKFFYDEHGSRLFNEICELEEYYPTRAENQILRDNIKEIAGFIGSGCRLVEFGSGTSAKTRHLLTHRSRPVGIHPHRHLRASNSLSPPCSWHPNFPTSKSIPSKRIMAGF